MKPLFTILILFSLTASVQANEERFINWWMNYDEQILVSDDAARHYRTMTQLEFNSLPRYEGTLTGSPEGKELEAALVLFSRPSGTVLLVTPRNIMKSMKFLNEGTGALAQCADDASWIVSLPENTWTEIDLNPYCTMDYDEDQIGIDLYWLEPVRRPLIEIVTAALTCEPHQLYGWDRRSQAYRLQAAKCTGSRPVENYSASGVMRQLFPLPKKAGPAARP